MKYYIYDTKTKEIPDADDYFARRDNSVVVAYSKNHTIGGNERYVVIDEVQLEQIKLAS